MAILDLCFLPNTKLVKTDEGIRYLCHNGGVHLFLDGTSKPLHYARENFGLILNQETVVSWARFFADHCEGAGDTFNTVDSRCKCIDKDGQMLQIPDPVLTAGPDLYQIEAFLVHTGHLYRVQFTVHPDGVVGMIKDEVICSAEIVPTRLN